MDDEKQQIIRDFNRWTPPNREMCDRAEISIQRAINCGWITLHGPTARAQLHATLRIALNMEVEAGGPYLVQEKVRPAHAPTAIKP